jgi:ketosteroid isomerase-like protein
MSENVERLRAAYSEWARGNMRAGRELFAPDAIFEPISDTRTASLGLDSFDAYMREFLAQWTDYRIDAEAFAEVGDTVLVTERQRGTGKTSGVSIESVFYAVWTFRNGLVIRARWESDRARALELAGLQG